MSKGELQAVAQQGDYCELWAQRKAASELASIRRPEGLECRAHGAKRSAQTRNTGPLKAARCEGAERPYRIVEHAQRASAVPEHRAVMREAEGRLGPRNLEGEARKYAGPYPRANMPSPEGV